MPSKLFSRATNDTLEAILRNDTYRYVRKGFFYSKSLDSLLFPS